MHRALISATDMFSGFYCFWRGLNQPIAKAVGQVMTANTVTLIRTFAAPFIPLLLYFDFVPAAFTLFVACGLLDSFDGMVATARQQIGYNDDQKLGAFLDAFCDKVFWIIVASSVLPLSNYHELPLLITELSIVICIILLLIETALAIVRVGDYTYERRSGDQSRRLLKATSTGKLKFTLEMTGLGGIILAYPDLHHWAFYIGFVSLIISVPFAVKSLFEKLSARDNPAL